MVRNDTAQPIPIHMKSLIGPSYKHFNLPITFLLFVIRWRWKRQKRHFDWTWWFYHAVGEM